MRTRVPLPRSAVGVVGQTLVLVLSLGYLLTSQLWLLLSWEAVTLVYLVFGTVAVWNGQETSQPAKEVRRGFAIWSWLVPLLSSAVGAYCAVVALVAQSARTAQAGLLASAASLGVVLSWAMLQVGFAYIYRALDSVRPGEGIRFPDGTSPCLLDYLYFSFTVGTSFATSDRDVLTLPIRRVVLIHSVLCFFYNALVVAVAFQVLQSLMTRAD